MEFNTPKMIALGLTALCTVPALAQNAPGKLTGKITTADGSPTGYLHVKLTGSKISTLTNADGTFEIKNIRQQDDTLIVEGSGIDKLVEPVTLATSGTVHLNLRVKKNAKGLGEVIVSAGRTPETIDEVPSSVTIVGLKAMEQNLKITSNLGDILENKVPGLAPSTGLSSNSGQTLRGRSFLVMIDGVPQSTPLRNGSMDMRALDPAVIERVEVVKGATAIYGNGAAGGLVNYITRMPRTDKVFNSQTSLGLTGSLTSAPNSMGGRLSQMFYGNQGKFSYVVSGVYEQTGEQKDAKGDIMPPVYGLGETDSYNGFVKLGYDFNEHHHVQFSYNYYSSRQKTNYTTVDGDYMKGIKTSAVLGQTNEVPQGVRGNHNIGLQFSGDTRLANTSYNVDVYYQSVDNVFFYSKSFEDGGTSRILSKKNGVRFVFNTPIDLGSVKTNLTYGIDLQNDVTSQPLVDGRMWVPEMKMFNLAPFAQAKINLTKQLVLKGGLRFEKVNIGVEDYATLPSVNTVTGAVTPSINVKGGNLDYNALVFNAGLRYNVSEFFSPYISYSQGFSVADIGLALRAAKVNDIAKISTEAVIINNYEAGFVSKYNNIRFEATAYVSTSELGINNRYDNGVYYVERTPERIYGYELALEARIIKGLNAGLSYTYVEGKVDMDNNGNFSDAKDEYLGGQRISAPKLAGHAEYTIIPDKLNVGVQYTGVLSRNRFAKTAAGVYDPFKGPVNAYHLFNALVGYKFNPTTSLSLGVENMFNADYYTARSQFTARNDNYIKGKGAAYRLTVNINL